MFARPFPCYPCEKKKKKKKKLHMGEGEEGGRAILVGLRECRGVVREILGDYGYLAVKSPLADGLTAVGKLGIKSFRAG